MNEPNDELELNDLSSVTGGVVSLAPGLPPFGLWKSTDGGANFTLLSPEGVCLNSLLELPSSRMEPR